jgi:hypothetical protein
MPACRRTKEEAREEDHRDDEHHSCDDAHPRRGLIQAIPPKRSNIALDRQTGRVRTARR